MGIARFVTFSAPDRHCAIRGGQTGLCRARTGLRAGHSPGRSLPGTSPNGPEGPDGPGGPGGPGAAVWPRFAPRAASVLILAPGPGGIRPVDAASAHHRALWDPLRAPHPHPALRKVKP